MENLVKVFENTEFGELRMVVVNDEPWFVGKDVAEALGYERGSKAVQDHVDEEDKDVVPIQDSIGRMQNTPVINESGVYSLVFVSKLPEAKRFKRWVTSEVLPSIRKTGSYQKPMSELEILAGSVQQLLEQQKRMDELEQKQQKQSEQIENIQEIAVYRPDNEWREKTNRLIFKMAGDNKENIREIRNESYGLLEKRLGVLLGTRLSNKRRRALDEGISRSKASEINNLDVIADDKKLIEGYVSIIKEMAIKYGVTI